MYGRYRRRGSMYVMVLGCTLMVTVIGLSALALTRVERRTGEGTSSLIQARLYAMSAIQIGLHRIQNDPDWRTTYPNGVWETDQPIGTGTYTLKGTDSDEQPLDNDVMDPLDLTGIGMQGDALYRLQITLVSKLDPLSCLEVALHAGNDLTFNSAGVYGDHIISANDSVNESGSTVNPDVEAVNAINGTGYAGTITTGITPRDVPDSATVFDYYIANGTSIAVPGYLIEKQLLSPASNPYGLTDPQGIYVVDCQGQDFTIIDSRVVGTLVLLNAGSGSQIRPGVHLEPAVADLPTLLVEGSFVVNTGASTLDEPLIGVNFNPPGTPYEGVEDGDTDDTYPVVVKGLVYISVDLVADDNATFQGVVVVGNTFTGDGNVTVNYGGNYLGNPPPGFRHPMRMTISPGTWQRVVVVD